MRKSLAYAVSLWLASAVASYALAQTPAVNLSNVADLQAQGEVEVIEDEMRLVLTTSRQGKEAASVQSQLRQALDSAMQAVKPMSVEPHMHVQTGNFSLYPQRDNNGRITGWQGSTELVLTGTDMPRISQAAARANSMVIGDIAFSVSRDLRARTEAQAQQRAVEAFTNKAKVISQQFGFSGYTLRQVQVQSQNDGYMRPMAAAMRTYKAEAADAGVAAEPGKSIVRVMISGSVQMR